MVLLTNSWRRRTCCDVIRDIGSTTNAPVCRGELRPMHCLSAGSSERPSAAPIRSLATDPSSKPVLASRANAQARLFRQKTSVAPDEDPQTHSYPGLRPRGLSIVLQQLALQSHRVPSTVVFPLRAMSQFRGIGEGSDHTTQLISGLVVNFGKSHVSVARVKWARRSQGCIGRW